MIFQRNCRSLLRNNVAIHKALIIAVNSLGHEVHLSALITFFHFSLNFTSFQTCQLFLAHPATNIFNVILQHFIQMLKNRVGTFLQHTIQVKVKLSLYTP